MDTTSPPPIAALNHGQTAARLALVPRAIAGACLLASLGACSTVAVVSSVAGAAVGVAGAAASVSVAAAGAAATVAKTAVETGGRVAEKAIDAAAVAQREEAARRAAQGLPPIGATGAPYSGN